MGVPLFFMVSGFLLLSSEKTDCVQTFYKNRVSRLCVPFLFWDIVYYFESCVLEGRSPGLLPFLNELTRQGSKYHLWFVYQIMALYLLMPFLKKIVDGSTRRGLQIFYLSSCSNRQFSGLSTSCRGPCISLLSWQWLKAMRVFS